MQFKTEDLQADFALKMKTTDDAYFKGILTYTERWADLCEQRSEDGDLTDEIIKQASDDADIDGITGYMYGVAVRFLWQYWIHGDQVALWHNRQYDVDTIEDGIVNPAILIMKTYPAE